MTKVTIFVILFISFVCYSLVVYTSATEYEYQNEMAGRGKSLFQEHNCIACHQIYGLGGFLGDDLTNVISAKGKGENYARAFIKSGAYQMPAFGFTDEQTNCIIEYLKYTDRSTASSLNK